MIRDTLTTAMKDAMRAKETRKLSTVRLILNAIKDRDIAKHGAGKEPVSIVMDMYFPGYSETAPVSGFTIVP